MENITFLMRKYLLLEINNKRDPRTTYIGSSLRMWAKACVRRHTFAYVARVSKV